MFVCVRCDSGFGYKSSLNRHLKTCSAPPKPSPRKVLQTSGNFAVDKATQMTFDKNHAGPEPPLNFYPSEKFRVLAEKQTQTELNLPEPPYNPLNNRTTKGGSFQLDDYEFPALNINFPYVDEGTKSGTQFSKYQDYKRHKNCECTETICCPSPSAEGRSKECQGTYRVSSIDNQSEANGGNKGCCKVKKSKAKEDLKRYEVDLDFESYTEVNDLEIEKNVGKNGCACSPDENGGCGCQNSMCCRSNDGGDGDKHAGCPTCGIVQNESQKN
jgi:hypothetical protein